MMLESKERRISVKSLSPWSFGSMSMNGRPCGCLFWKRVCSRILQNSRVHCLVTTLKQKRDSQTVRSETETLESVVDNQWENKEWNFSRINMIYSQICQYLDSFVIFPLYITMMDNQDVTEVQTFSFSSRDLTKYCITSSVITAFLYTVNLKKEILEK